MSYIDDTDKAISWSGSWTHYTGDGGAQNATAWFGQSFSGVVCGTAANESTAAVPFSGTGVALLSEFVAAQGRFWCSVDNQERHFFNGGSAAGIGEWRLNVTRCAVSGLKDTSHTLHFGQTAEDCGNVGITLDYALVNSSATSGGVEWWSNFDRASAPPNLADTTRVLSSVASETSALGSTSSILSSSGAPTSGGSSGGGGSSSTAIGVGVGVGVGGAIGLVLVVLWWFRRKSRTPAEASSKHFPEAKPTMGYAMSEGGATLPYAGRNRADTYASSPTEFERRSQFVPEVQEFDSTTGTSYYSASPARGGLANPATFRERGGGH